MAFQNSSAKSFLVPSQKRVQPLRQLTTRIGSGLLALGLSLSVALPSLAADPFRPDNGHDIGPLTEGAFEAIFKEGDYDTALTLLEQAETEEANEPLVHAMLASMAYLKGESGLPEVLERAQLTEQTARDLVSSDPLRGHLYTAVGIFLRGAHLLKTEGVAKGTPTALGMLQEVFAELDAAEAVDPEDSELNLLKGYMDLMLAVNLPFSNPDDAISRMSQYGSPEYLTQRGIAIGYRDLAQFDEALVAVDKALAAAGDNPELYYLKAQLLVRQGDTASSLEWFNKALTLKDQLPDKLGRQIIWEECQASDDGRNCAELAGY
ncbi:MAG: Sll0314/Alr1548 family TPR repeat-containing protein [Phormidesmis sp.]